MTRVRLVAASWVPVAMVLACAAGDAVRAEIKAEIRGNRVIYTSRPARKPDHAPVREAGARRPLDAAPPPLDSLVMEASRRHGMDPDLVAAVIGVESAFNPKAVSPKGARGLMQLMPETARRYGVLDPHDPGQNIEGGIAYLKDLIEMFRGNLTLALAAYNAGPGAVERARGVPPYEETQHYIERIETRYGPLSSGATVGASAPLPTTAGSGIRARRDASGAVVWTNRSNRP